MPETLQRRQRNIKETSAGIEVATSAVYAKLTLSLKTSPSVLMIIHCIFSKPVFYFILLYWFLNNHIYCDTHHPDKPKYLETSTDHLPSPSPSLSSLPSSASLSSLSTLASQLPPLDLETEANGTDEATKENDGKETNEEKELQEVEEIEDEEGDEEEEAGESVEDRGEDEPVIICSGCNKEILSGKYQIVPTSSTTTTPTTPTNTTTPTATGRMYFHTACLVCGTCGVGLVGKLFAEKGGKLICEQDVKKASAECKRCKEPILGRRIVVDENKYPSYYNSFLLV